MNEAAKCTVVRRMTTELAGPDNNSRIEMELRWIIEAKHLSWYEFPEYMPYDE